MQQKKSFFTFLYSGGPGTFIFSFCLLLIILNSTSLPLFPQSAGDELISLVDTGLQSQFWAGVDHFRGEHYQQAARSLKPVLDACLRQQESAPTKAAFPLDSGQVAAAANLYALSLIRLGHREEGFQSFGECHRLGILDGEGLLNYSRGALEKKEFKLAFQLAQEACTVAGRPSGGAASFQNEAGWNGRCNYVAALAAFGLGDWLQAEQLFEESRRLDEVAFAENPYHQYYLGLAQFRQNKWSVAYQTLQSLYHSHPNHPLSEKTARLAIHCTLQLWQGQDNSRTSSQWWNKAAELALDLVHTASERQLQPDSLSHHQAVILAARIYRDGGRHQEALSLLEPYLERQDAPSLSCRFLAAEILASQGKSEGSQETLELAAAAYGKLGEICSPSGAGTGAGAEFSIDSRGLAQELRALGDTASYRQGELLYSMEKYREAAQAFAFYRRNYPAGSHGDAALYFNGEALRREGFHDQAILLHETLLARYPESSFAFSSQVALMGLYKTKGEYQLALEQGRQLQTQFPQQAKTVDVEGQLEDLALLEQGADSRTVELLHQYRAAGECGTREGRRLAVQLAARYRSSGQEVTAAERILLELLDALGLQADHVADGTDDRGLELTAVGELPRRWVGEEEVAAQGSYLLADLYRQAGRYRESAQLFLVSARFFLLAGNGTEGGGDAGEAAAAALYRGAESFDVAGLRADCRAVAHQLESLFPQSRWTSAVRIFL